MELGLATTLHTTFADAVSKTREALAENGFGVLTEIDVTATLKTKLDADMENYLILGACNPPLAHRAVEIDRQIGAGNPRRDAVVEATTSRLVPVTMAAGTTVLGMVPLLFDDLFASMAVTIMGGLGFATLLAERIWRDNPAGGR